MRSASRSRVAKSDVLALARLRLVALVQHGVGAGAERFLVCAGRDAEPAQLLHGVVALAGEARPQLVDRALAASLTGGPRRPRERAEAAAE